ncbi:hypothetical protein [Luteibacter sp.]|uniref:hypothetical protein n=1 Tax=Luteibacter sp. TaxID=1886636 RepID=UPI0025C07607|nr:hypothetical protein [Luteibacter sp.]
MKASFHVRRTATVSVSLMLACAAANAHELNVRPSPGNTVNTPMNIAMESQGFTCQVTVESVWISAGESVYAAFSNDKIWYRVKKAAMLPLLYTAYSMGRKVCYQTRGDAINGIDVNIIFLDPRP